MKHKNNIRVPLLSGAVKTEGLWGGLGGGDGLLWVWAWLLAGERQQQQHGQVPQAAEEELAGAAAVALVVEAEGQEADVQVDGQGDDGEGPGGQVQRRRHRRQADQAQAVSQRHTLAHARVGDGHHAVAASGVVLPQVPAEGVEVGELPAEQEAAQHQGTWGGRERIFDSHPKKLHWNKSFMSWKSGQRSLILQR